MARAERWFCYLAPRARVDEILSRLAARFRCTAGRSVLREELYYDSFDDRLYRAGCSLVVVGATSRRPRLELADLDGATPRHRSYLPAKLARSGLAFSRDLAPGLLRDELAALLDPRRLLPKIALSHELRSLRIGPVRASIRVELSLDRWVPLDGSPVVELDLPASLRFAAGRSPLVAELRKELEELGLEVGLEGRLPRAARRAGLPLGTYSSKLEVKLSPIESAAGAARRLHMALLDTLEKNEDGVLRDLDPEFLHDFRVAIRRSRAALGQLRDVFPGDAVAHFKNELSWLGEVTGPKRDLDVQLERHVRNIAALADRTPESLRQTTADLEPLAALLKKRQQQALADLTFALRSPRYLQWKADWRRFLEEPTATERSAPLADQEILPLFADQLRRLFRRLRRRGQLLRAGESPAEAFHELRIDGKKLRYLLEFSRSLFSQEKLEPVLRRLKILQDDLGELNDLEVQKASLRVFAQTLAEETCPVATILAIGRLIEQCNFRQRELHDHFAESLAELKKEPVRKFFKELKAFSSQT